MITAEHPSSGVRIETDQRSVGALPQDRGSYYNEVIIINYLGDDIYAVDHRNLNVVIKQEPAQKVDANWLEIRYRAYTGARKLDWRGLEVTPTKHQLMMIPYDLIRAQPIFVEEINAVLCFGDHLSTVQHPHSEKAVAERTKAIQEAEARRQSDAPLVLIANDPTGKVTELFVELNGIVCSTRVTHFREESDTIMIGLRNREYSVDEFARHYTTFTELAKQKSERVWHFAGFRLSSNRLWFEQVLEVERKQKPEMISLTAVTNLITESRATDAETIQRLTEEARDAKQRASILEAACRKLKEGDYEGQRVELDFRKLELERAKLQQAKEDAERTIAAERLKLRKEIINTLGVVAKTLAVMVPIGIGIYKAIQAARS